MAAAAWPGLAGCRAARPGAAQNAGVGSVDTVPPPRPHTRHQGAAQLADGTWRLFQGLGTGTVLEAKCDYRVAEVLMAARVMRQLNEGGLTALNYCIAFTMWVTAG